MVTVRVHRPQGPFDLWLTGLAVEIGLFALFVLVVTGAALLAVWVL